LHYKGWSSPEALIYFRFLNINRSVVVCVVLCRLLSSCPFSLGHCIVCPTLIYDWWLHLWYHQTFLNPKMSGKTKVSNLLENNIIILQWMRRRIFFSQLEIYSQLFEAFICFLNVPREAEEQRKTFHISWHEIIGNISGQNWWTNKEHDNLGINITI
jgi:hypothetical protein